MTAQKCTTETDANGMFFTTDSRQRNSELPSTCETEHFYAQQTSMKLSIFMHSKFSSAIDPQSTSRV